MDSFPLADFRGVSLLRFLVGEAPREVPTSETWAAWMLFSARHRVVPLLHQMIESVGSGLTDKQLAELRDAQIDVMAVAARYDRYLIDVAGLLTGLKVAFVAIKGAATANLDYPSPSWRQYGDLDILVDSRDLAMVRGALSGTGWNEWYPLPGGHEKFTHALTLTRRGGWELDLHQRIAHRAVGLRIPVREILSNRVRFELAGVEVFALAAEDRLIHAAVHAEMSRLESSRLSSVADVVLLSSSGTISVEEVLGRAESWRIRPLVERAVSRAFYAAGLAVPMEWREAMDRPLRSRDRLIEAAYGPSRRRPGLEEIAHLRLMPTWSDRSRYLKSFAFPGDNYRRRSGRRGLTAQTLYLARRMVER